MSSDPQDIGAGLMVDWYVGPAGTDSATRRRWQIMTQDQYIQLSFEQMCALRHFFRDEGVTVPPFQPRQPA